MRSWRTSPASSASWKRSGDRPTPSGDTSSHEAVAGPGNTNAGDGKRFKGRGPIQLTGRANYQRFGDLLSVDLLADPPRAANPSVAFRAAGLFWSKKGLNELADVATPAAFKEITRRINGGTNGLAERQAFYAVARKVLGVADTPALRGRAREPARRCQPTNRPSSAAGRFVPARPRPGRKAKKRAPAGEANPRRGRLKTRSEGAANGRKKGSARGNSVRVEVRPAPCRESNCECAL